MKGECVTIFRQYYCSLTQKKMKLIYYNKASALFSPDWFLCDYKKALWHNEQLLRSFLISNLVMYFSTLPSSAISVPCILPTLTRLKRVCRNFISTHPHMRILVSCFVQ